FARHAQTSEVPSYRLYTVDTTPDYDYNATFEYIFFSNASTEDLDKFLRASEEEFYEGEDMGVEEDTTFSTTMSTTDSSIAKVSVTF
uniref:Uncharacterized protein n=1 Tax=Oncorhynchus mykiss TaxID=8022 RepID=A0A8K9WQ94_ONCMY